MARGCGIACPISNVHQTRATAAADMYIHMDMDIDLDMGLDMEHRKSDMFTNTHMQKCVLRFQARVLQLLYIHVPFPRCPKHEPQQNFEV